MDISDWRNRIDEIDGQLAELLSERSRCVIEIGKIKRQRDCPFMTLSERRKSSTASRATIAGHWRTRH